jgi:uncharacterized membrane protein YfcA
MPETLASLWEIEGLGLLFAAVFAAGLVRGFAGFGSGMIIMPVAATVLDPVAAIIFMLMAELLGPLPNLPAAWRDGARGDAGRLVLGLVVAVPAGVLCLTLLSPDAFGWIVSLAVLTLLALLMAGWRYHGVLTPRLTIGTGALGGFMGGFAGIPGPPVIMLYMSSLLPISVIRANFLLYLLAFDVVMIAVFWGWGLFVWQAAVLGLIAGVPNVIANMIGARLFDPRADVLFRRVAYLIIATSAIIGLPLWK